MNPSRRLALVALGVAAFAAGMAVFFGLDPLKGASEPVFQFVGWMGLAILSLISAWQRFKESSTPKND